MEKTVECTNTRINKTIARLQRSDNLNKSSKLTWVKKADRAEIDALFGLINFRGILGVNLHMNDRLSSNDSHFVFGVIMSKNRFRFLKSHICFDNPQKEHSCGKQIDSQLLERSGKSSIQIFRSMLHHRNIFQLMRHYTQCYNKLPSANIIAISHIVMVCYWSQWMMQHFLIHTNCTVCCKTEGLRWSLLLEVYHWLHKVFSNRNRSWSAYHRKNHLDRLFLHKYWVDKLASWSWHCNSWDIVEREKRNTIWTFWPPKQRDF